MAQDYDLGPDKPLTRMANLAEPLVVRALVAGRLTAERDGYRLIAERGRAGGGGPRRLPTVVRIFVARPLCALALPPALRGLLRRAFRPAFSG